MKKKVIKYLAAATLFLMPLYNKTSFAETQNEIVKKTGELPKAGIDNEHILISIACLIIITGAFFVFFKKREKK